MFDKLIPKDKRFFELFQKQADLLHQGAQALQKFANDPSALQEVAHRLERLEHEADNLTHEILILLDKSFITPIDREDIHSLALALDDCMDYMEAVTERLSLYELPIAPEPVKQLVKAIVDQTLEVDKVIPLIKEFKYETIIPHCREINRLENLADSIMRDALGKLFKGNTPPLEVMKWKDIYDFLENATDSFEHVAGLIEGIVLKHG
jgi:uncharacterized protein